jgi:hypothetical protein
VKVNGKVVFDGNSGKQRKIDYKDWDLNLHSSD